MPNCEWKIFRILPNITCLKSFDNEFLSICPADDERVREILAYHPNISPLVENFYDQFNRQRKVSVLILKKDAPGFVNSFEYLIDFRNIVAISSVLFSCQEKIRRPFSYVPVFSDYFNLYPIHCNLESDEFALINTPALTGVEEIGNFIGQVMPGLPVVSLVEWDDYVYQSLLNLLNRKHKRGTWKLRVLFRSLEVAYQACLMPNENESSIHDFGKQISLWVNSLEILTRPKSGQAGFLTVKQLFDQAKWILRTSKSKKYIIRFKRNKYRVPMIVKILKELYDARNDFMHGNPVTQKRIFPFRNENLRPLNHLAPLMYRFALGASFHEFGKKYSLFDASNPLGSKYLTQRNYETAFLTGTGKI